MSIIEQEKTWNHLGQKDPFWAILSHDGKERNQWDVEEFFKTGHSDVAQLLNKFQQVHPTFSKHSLIDFGCGVGRLAQAFAAEFEQVVGIDISTPMVEMANKHNKFPDRCRYLVNVSPQLEGLQDGSFDLVYSGMVLQHNRPELIRSYIKEFIRILKPGGLLYFQLPVGFKTNLTGQMMRYLPSPCIKLMKMARARSFCVYEMHFLPAAEVKSIVEAQGAKLLKVQENSGSVGSYVNGEFYISK